MTQPTPNRLAAETSPYLRQHQHNPVDWYPWGAEALARAKAENRPIFLSIGYSACHWCHVMERESFEDPAIAELMNEHFINIKVDREERPDLDQIYMSAVQALTGHGGWPMSVFLTPELEPFYGGTYYPPRDSRGMPGFPRVLQSVAQAWRDRPGEIAQSAAELTGELRRTAAPSPPDSGDAGSPLALDILDRAYQRLSRAYDPVHGGFGDAPKFPHPMDLRVLLRHHARTGDEHALEMVRKTLDHMARGGIHDHLGGGFARYSTDARWLVPHFEKMLYDNALLATTYVEAYQATRDTSFAKVARSTLDYLLERMTAPHGGFYATEDADSEGVEGKYYVWTLAEIRSLLGQERTERFAYVYDVTETGNWEHKNILNMPKPLEQSVALLGMELNVLETELTKSRRVLKTARNDRIPPAQDHKILVSWNGLAIAAFATASAALKESRYQTAARRAAEFLLSHCRQPDGRLFHSYADATPRFNAYLDDYACLMDGLTRLFETTGEPHWLEASIDLAGTLIREFHDSEGGGFYYTGTRHESLLYRPKEVVDSATPAASAMAATALLRIAAIADRTDLRETAEAALRSVGWLLDRAPTAAGQSLIALDFLLSPVRQLVLVAGTEAQEFEVVKEMIAARFLPDAVLALRPDETAPVAPALRGMWADRPSREGRVTLYHCHNFTCDQPWVGLERIESALSKVRG